MSNADAETAVSERTDMYVDPNSTYPHPSSLPVPPDVAPYEGQFYGPIEDQYVDYHIGQLRKSQYFDILAVFCTLILC